MRKLFVEASAIKRRVEVDTDPDTSYLNQEGFEEHLEAYQAGEYTHVGVWAEVEVVINDVIQTIRSGGLWGIEHSDSHASVEYLDEIYKEEKAALVAILEALGFEVRQASHA